eukprot:20241-Eustigmatos_ZCMA.PRE.1
MTSQVRGLHGALTDGGVADGASAGGRGGHNSGSVVVGGVEGVGSSSSIGATGGTSSKPPSMSYEDEVRLSAVSYV